jgi:4-diphosphocytidyl-2-C-methyl-D-erythritol kinase
MSAASTMRPFTGQFGATTAVVRAPAKINLSLRVVGRREDGFHLLDSLVVPIDLFDRVAMKLSPARRTSVALACDTSEIPVGSRNLAVRAAHLYLEHAAAFARIDVRIEKRIPAGAGLGGGSSDAGAVLRAMNALAVEPIGKPTLQRLALELGADVPFFVVGRAARMRGVGERLDPLGWVPPWPLVVARCEESLSTADVYGSYDREAPHSLTNRRAMGTIRGSTLQKMPLRDLLINDLEAAANRIRPGVDLLKKRLLALGARGALMTGSGSAVFGFWERDIDAEAAAKRLRAEGCWATVARALERAPGVILQ